MISRLFTQMKSLFNNIGQLNKKQLKPTFLFSIVCMFLFSLSFLIMPVASDLALDGKLVLLRLSGIWFWLSLIAGYALFILVNKNRKRLMMKQKKQAIKVKPGIIKIFSNKWACIADIAAVISLFGFLITVLIIPQKYVTYIFLFAAIFTIQMHGMLNGENFKYISKIIKAKQEGTQNESN